MPAYSHLLDEERDQIAIMRAAGLDLRHRRGASRGNCDATPCPAGVIRRFMPPEPISYAGGVKPYSRKIRR
jgi:hypothetical protein